MSQAIYLMECAKPSLYHDVLSHFHNYDKDYPFSRFPPFVLAKLQLFFFLVRSITMNQ